MSQQQVLTEKIPTTSEGHAIHHNLMVNASLEKLFAAVSDPKHLSNWWPLECSGQAELNGKYRFYFGPEYDWEGQVVQFETNASFHVKMTNADEDWTPTSLGFDLSQEGQRVKLSFWHVGWPACNEHYKRSSFCWAMLLNDLKNYVEKGVIVPFEDRE